MQRKRKDKDLQNDVPKNMAAKTLGKIKMSDKLSHKAKINERNPEKSKGEKTDNLNSFCFGPHCLENGWLDKCKYEDAEVKYYQNIVRQLKKESQISLRKEKLLIDVLNHQMMQNSLNRRKLTLI